MNDDKQDIRKITDKEKNVMITVGKQIQIYRKQKGLTQSEFASEIGCSITAFGEYERGETRVSIINLMMIARILGVSVAELLRDEKYIPYFDELDRKMKSLNKDNLSEKQKEEIEKLLLHTVDTIINHTNTK